MNPRARARGTHDLPRVDYRPYADVNGEWSPGTVVYDGGTLTVVALDDGTTQFVYDTRALRGLGEGNAGDRVLDGGQAGTLVRCHTCDGHGTLFDPDPDQPEITAPAPELGDLDTDAYKLLEIIERTRYQHGVYLVGLPGSPVLRVFQRVDHERDHWYSPSGKPITADNLRALERAGLVVSYAPDSGPLEPPPALIDAIRRHRDTPEGAEFTITAPAPTLNPHDAPPDSWKALVLGQALRWLYETEQPPGAMISHHGYGSADLELIPSRRINLAPQAGERQRPIITISVAHPIVMTGGGACGVRNPLAPGEIEQWAAILTEAGYEVADVWSGYPERHGSIQLATPAHPSLRAAQDLYQLGCMTHPKGVGTENARGDSFCACGWSVPGHKLLVHPEFPGPIRENRPTS